MKRGDAREVVGDITRSTRKGGPKHGAFGDVAQSVEQRIHIPRVAGSKPAITTKFQIRGVAQELEREAVCVSGRWYQVQPPL